MPMPDSASESRPAPKPAKDLYRHLRTLTCDQLWQVEVPRFDRADARQRMDRVGVIRAVSVVFAESGTPAQQAAARAWLRQLLKDPAEKVRRYALNALPKLGAGADDEAEMLTLLRAQPAERERKFLGQALAKIGGAATLDTLPTASAGPLRQAEQKIKARLAREADGGRVNLTGVLTDFAGLRIHLRGRNGLEEIVAGEAEDALRAGGQFRLGTIRPGQVELLPVAPFSLADIFRLRCFGTVGFALGSVTGTGGADVTEQLARLIASPRTLQLLRTFSAGAIRYRLAIADRGHQRGAVRQLAERAYELCPEILNDPTEAPWTIEVHATDHGAHAELVPELKPDPRLHYRQGDVPAASHPPLAACLAWLGGQGKNEVVWDPFCGSGLELVERAMLGGVRRLIGSDLSPEALEVSRRNFAAANLPKVPVQFLEGDFRDVARGPELGPNSTSLILTNPPMGMRIQLPNLRGLLHDLLKVAAYALQPHGRIVFPNPVKRLTVPPGLELEYGRPVDMGGFDCQLELYRKRP